MKPAAALLLFAGLLAASPAPAAKPKAKARAKAAAKAPAKASAKAAAKPKAKTRAKTKAAPPPAAVPLHPPRVSSEPVSFIWPPEGTVVAAESEFVLGNVADPTAHFAINGQTVTVHKDGGFLAWLPVSPGAFVFRAELDMGTWTATNLRGIVVPAAPVPLPSDKLSIDAASLSPRADLELRAGDWWTARMKATRGQAARVRVGGGPWRDMREADPAQGVYEAVMQVAPGEEFGPDFVEYQLGSGWSSVRVKGTARVTATRATPPVATIRPNAAGFVNVKTGPNEGFMNFPLAGTRFAVTGRDGAAVRLALGAGLSGWADAKDVDVAYGVPPPHAVVGDVGVTETPGGATVRISLTDKVPFEIVEDDDLGGLTVHIYSATGHTSLVVHEGPDEFVDHVRWRQEASDAVAVSVRLKPGRKVWGYSARNSGGALRVELRRPPVVDPKRPLKGLRVMLDPGHMPSAPGALGPLGTKEMDANYAIAKAAAALLEKEGAAVFMTRASTSDEVGLVERPRLAAEKGADVFVSLHNNALPDGANPFSKPRGFTVFYYHPHSLALGRALHAAYAARDPLPDEGLQWDNLLVARLTSMPAVLIENAYMIFPEQEADLNEPAFRSKLAGAVVAGLKAFALEAGERKAK